VDTYDPDRFEVRYVSANGGMRWNHQWVNVSHTCIGEYIGLEEIDDGIWNVYFGLLTLGQLLERHMRIEDAYGRLLASPIRDYSEHSWTFPVNAS
jgi:putative transposase